MKKIFITLIIVYCLFIVYKQLYTEKNNNLKINTPNKMLAIYNGQDTLISISDTSAKFIALYDSTLCTSCQTSNLFIWEEFANKNNNNFQTYIIFSAAKNDLFSVKEDLKKMRYNFPVYIDSGYSFIKMNPNHLWNNIDYHFFLLDEKQKISIIGFPFLKKKKEEEYIKVIEKMRNNISI